MATDLADAKAGQKSDDAEDWLDAHLAYAPHFSLFFQGADRLLLLSEERSFRLNGAVYQALVPLLDGQLSGREILDRLAGAEEATTLHGRLERLIRNGYVTKVAAGVDMRRQAYWSALGEVPADVLARLRATRLAVMSLGSAQVSDHRAATALTAGFADLGFTTVAEGAADAALTLVLLDDYLQPAAGPLAREMAAAGRRWLPFKPGGNRSWLGPLIGPGAHCFACLTRRLLEHRSSDLLVDLPQAGVRPARAWLPHTLSTAVGFAGIELARLARGADSRLTRGLLEWNPEQGQSSLHAAPRFADCPICGAPPLTGPVEARPIRPSSVTTSAVETAWRSLTIPEALERLDPCVSPITGLVDGTESIEIAPGLHVCHARHASRMSVDPRLNRQFGRPDSASGKGVTADQARASCLAEAVERYACAWTGTEPRRVARRDALGDSALHPHRLLNYSDYQYDNRATLNPGAFVTDRIPRRFDEGAAIDWSPAWSLRDDAMRWLPARYVYFNYDGQGVEDDHPFCSADSNGTATGATLEEAMFHALLELIERDGVALWWYNRLQMPEIGLDGIDDRLVGAMTAHYGTLGRDLRLIDLTTDIGVPVVAALSVRRDGTRPLLGLGAHLDPRLAAMRALTEMNQMLMFEDAGPDTRIEPMSIGDAAMNFLNTGSIDGQPYLLPRAGTVRRIDELPTPFPGDSVSGGLRFLVERLAAMGHDTIAFDYSRKDLPLACARIVVPGLRHFWSRRGPGRLYDVPVRMGRLARPLQEAELNPIGFFI
ncbi:MAG TPA: TOMM precursor leader peptide-binding protein [Reyranella sp.]|nr:TOMM precursor leader peptide-binding protein [Reyranella sp.]